MSFDLIGGGGGAPSGAAGGDLGGTYPNPTVQQVGGAALGTGVATALSVNTNASGGFPTTNGAASLSGKTLDKDNIYQNQHVSSSLMTITATTTLATIPGLTQVLTAGATYLVQGMVLFGTAPTGSNGFKIQLINGDTLTVTTLNAFFQGQANNASPIVGTANALASGLNTLAAMVCLWFEAIIVVNAGGTLLVQAAENTASGTVTIPAGGAYMVCTRVA